MEDLHNHFGHRQLWEKWDVSKAATFRITEIWGHDDMPVSAVESRPIQALSLDNWLEEPSQKYILTGQHTRILRLVWVGLDPESSHASRRSPSTRELQQLLDRWDLQEGYDYALSCFAGVSSLPPRQDARIFTATYHPKLAVAWSHRIVDGGRPETRAVVFAEGEERAELLRVLQSKWSPSLVGHAMFPAFLCSLMLSQELDTTLEDIKEVVRNVEARTGHHRFSTRRQTRPAAGELGSLSAEMSGCSAKLANGTRKLKVVETLNAFMLQHAGGGADAPSGRPDEEKKNIKDGNQPRAYVTQDIFRSRPESTSHHHRPEPSPSKILTHHLGLLRDRAEMQSVDSAYVQQRVQVQIAALFHLIAQQDNAIAFETASATRSIAKDSLQDSSSMKMLALVAMFFLPGSFVAALFSAPLFDWDAASSSSSISVGTRPQFALFWAVAIPLTVATFALYAMWIVMQKKRLVRRLKGSEV